MIAAASSDLGPGVDDDLMRGVMAVPSKKRFGWREIKEARRQSGKGSSASRGDESSPY